MSELGHFALCLAWLLAIIGTVSGAYAAIKRNYAWHTTARNATIAVWVCSGIAILALALAFLGDDYTNQYVWSFSNKSMPEIYKITAIWGGMDGSMLLWAFILSTSCALVALRAGSINQPLLAWTLGVLNSSTLFFLVVTVFFTNPFRHIKADFIPPDGNGLNPLLQNPYMAVHPPMLYLGFTTFAVPFAFCLAALFSRQTSNEWIQLTRRWTLVAWCFLTIGIALGGHWAYLELGWGGFWAWDPVENASFLPWLTGTAFLHSVMVQERKNMLKFWNVWLIVGTYALTVFGTFLTRSGVVQSVHAFASTDVGWIFLVYLGLIIGVTACLTYVRRNELRSSKGLESFLSRETFFLLNNLVFLSICFATFWGVMFPVLSEAITGQKQAVGIPFFNTVNVPLFLVLIALMGIGPLLAWRKATIASLRKTFLKPFAGGLAVSLIFLWAGITDFYAVLSYGLCTFVFLTIVGEFHRGVKSIKDDGSSLPPIAKLVRRHRVRYGGYLVHFGVVIATIAITASMAHKVEREFSLAPGESLQVGRFNFELSDLGSRQTENFQAWFADITIYQAGNKLDVLRPELRSYFRNQESTTEVALRMGIREDIYLVLGGMEQGRAALKLFINPLQIWLWIGVVIMALGTVVVLPAHGQTVRAEALAGSSEAVKVT